MINANELRIGNWVMFGDDLKKVTPSIISTTASDGKIDFLRPIPLTPEILEKCGFVVDENRWKPNHEKWKLLTLEGFDLIVKPEDNSIYKFWDTDDNWYSWGYPEIKSVHQLQNLYFALTNEELKIEL